MDARSRGWNARAGRARFTLPLDVELLGRHVDTDARILDFGCGYGRVSAQLVEEGFSRVMGLDASPAMLARARRTVPEVPVAVSDGVPLPCADGSVDSVLLFAVLTCIPDDHDQQALCAELSRVLAPRGVLYACDFLLHADDRNIDRYRRDHARFGTYGVFELEDGAVLRHHDPAWIRELLASFETLAFDSFPATSMRGNPTSGFRFLGRKPA
ncbi:MAG: class I SAM-dependent methyltransferase [Myxococcota bacterium]